MAKFGAFVPQGWKLEFSGLGAAEAWSTAKDIAQQAEAFEAIMVTRSCSAASRPASR